MELVNLKLDKLCKMFINNTGEYLPGQNVIDDIRKTGIWSKEETSVLIDVLHNYNGTVIDVGANCGYFSIISMLYNNLTIAIEANEKFKEYIYRSMEINNFNLNNFVFHEKFVSDSKEKVLFDGWTGHTSLIKNNKSTYKDTISIDELCDEALFIKIDIEGCEPQAIKSAKNLIINNKVRYLMFEYTYVIDGNLDINQIEMVNFLVKNNYKIYHVINTLPEIVDITKKTNDWYTNFLNTKITFPNIKTAGTNLLAVLENEYTPRTDLFE